VLSVRPETAVVVFRVADVETVKNPVVAFVFKIARSVTDRSKILAEINYRLVSVFRHKNLVIFVIGV